ncbi:MAG: rhodanese-like domain-containing protein [Bacteroidia bacterium]|nr:rhodanese-like domain-containing protein [Bacteroidia bacterium]
MRFSARSLVRKSLVNNKIMNIKEITAKEAFGLITEGALLVDVREKDEVLQTAFQVNEIENIPYSTFDDNYSNLPQNRKIVLACHMGMRSLRAAQFLVIQGWDEAKIYNMDGGMEAWKKAGLSVKSAPRTFSFAKPESSCGCGSGGCC